MTPQEAATALRALALDIPRAVDEAGFKRLEAEASAARGRIHSRTGRLARSVKVVRTAEGPALQAGGAQAPHAAAVQYGATIRPHTIRPRSARVLAFVSAGELRFANQVRHPGARIAAQNYLRVDERALERAADNAVQQAADRDLR